MQELYPMGDGYQPLVLTEHWQLAQLNYTAAQAPEALAQFDQHTFTDETFTLLDGRALLITYDPGRDEMELMSLKRHITYNVPCMMRHNIAMEQGSVVLITEGRDAHLKGCNHIPITPEQARKIIAMCCDLWNHKGDT